MSRLALLDLISSQFPDTHLDNVQIIACQHLLGCTSILFDYFNSIGLNYENTSLIGKCYSTSLGVCERLSLLGSDVCPSSQHFCSHLPFDYQFETNIEDFVNKRLDKLLDKSRKTIILDDGGHLIAKINEKIEDCSHIIGVEQTSSGFHMLSNYNLKFPVINIARAKTKLQIEASFLSEGIVNRLETYLQMNNLSPKNVLVIGNGAMGINVANVLKATYAVSIFDHEPSRSDISQKEFLSYLRNADIVIGATGRTSLSKELHTHLKPGTVLASISSSDREFDAVHLRQKTARTDHAHANLCINGIHLLNCGFPINFFGGLFGATPLEKIQLTLTLLFAGVCQANSLDLEKTPRTFIELDSKLEDLIETNIASALAIS